MYDVNKLPSAKNSKNEVPADGYESDVKSDQADEILLIDHDVEEVQNLSASDNDVEVPHQSDDSTPSSDEEVRDSPPVESQTVFEPRRSKRSTAGKHSNPFKLPKGSVLEVHASPSTEVNEFLQYTETVKSLQSCLEKGWAQYLSKR